MITTFLNVLSLPYHLLKELSYSQYLWAVNHLDFVEKESSQSRFNDLKFWEWPFIVSHIYVHVNACVYL